MIYVSFEAFFFQSLHFFMRKLLHSCIILDSLIIRIRFLLADTLLSISSVTPRFLPRFAIYQRQSKPYFVWAECCLSHHKSRTTVHTAY